MKSRILPILLLLSLFLTGCGFFSERILEPVTFYYLETDYRFGREPGVIASEEREASGHRHDLSYLLALYLIGPVEEEHRSPLPPGTRIVKPEQQGRKISMELVNPAYPFSDAELSLACACLTLTCFDITDADRVDITYQEKILTMTKENLTLFDDGGASAAVEETQ